ncbi:hypothetical protein MRBLMI12_000512 [Microbacterium sp. LMI12-1-1.1]|uniref:hypothetical protein n=1 Tax=Microbacterium sp. LMI12-1-1.1 TaxID=3135225 RepID=UPI003443B940
MASQNTYRHAKTGVVRDYPATIARRFPDLIEVEPDAKPLAYTPIPQSSIDAYLESQEADEAAVEDDATDDTITKD